VLVQTFVLDQADTLQVGLDDVTDLGSPAMGRILASFLEVAATRVEHERSSSTRKVTSPPLRNTAEMMRVSATIHW
jgi:hypothetical protein